MKISSEADYAIRIVMHLYKNGKKQLKRDIVKECDVPRDWGFSIITKLTNGDILLSNKGRNGGVVFNREKEEVTILDIITIFDRLSYDKCLSTLKNCKKDLTECKLCKELIRINNNILDMMSEVKVKDLIEIK